MTQKDELSKSLITNSISSEYDLADSFFGGFFCENLDVDKKDLNGQVISDKSQFSSDPFKEYDFNETSHGFQVFSRENLIAQQKKDPEIHSLFNKALSEDEILQSLWDIIFEMEYSCANGDLLMFQQMQTGLLNVKLFYQKVFGQRYFLWLMKIPYLAILVLPNLIKIS